MKHRIRRGSSLAAAELVATLIPGNVAPPPEDRRSPLDLDASDVAFGVGFVLFAAGLALVWLPLAFLFCGAGIAALAWRLA